MSDDPCRALRLLLHAQRQGFQTLEQRPGIERRQRRSGVAEIVVQILVDPLLVGKDDPAEAPALAVDMLGRRIDDDMGAEFERLLLQRRREDVVDDDARADAVGDLRDRGDVDDFERRIGRAFEEEQLGVRPHRRFPLCHVAPVDERRLDAVFRHQRFDHPAAGAEQRPRGHHMVARLHRAEKRGRDRRHARRGRPRILGAFERAHALFEHVDRRVGIARIDEARLVALEARLGRFRTVVDEALRQIHRLRRFAELRAHGRAMDELGGGLPGFLVRHRHHPDTKKPAAKSRAGPYSLAAHGPLATCFTWLQADRQITTG